MNLPGPERGLSALTNRFVTNSLDAAAFGHREHICVAYDLLSHYDFLDATVLYVKGIRALAASIGADDKFHMTTTVAWLSIIAERMASSKQATCDDFLKLNTELLSNEMLDRHYSRERLDAPLARKQFVLPDIS